MVGGDPPAYHRSPQCIKAMREGERSFPLSVRKYSFLTGFDWYGLERIISESTSKSVNKILRKVVTDKEGTASLADIYGFNVGGKTGTAKKYGSEKNINTFISIFPETDPKYVLLVMLDEPKGAPEISYNYRGNIISGISRNEAGWNAVYVAGKIIKKIGPILAINNDEVYNNHVVKKSN